MLACLVSACGPAQIHQSHVDGPDRNVAIAKPPIAPQPPPPNVTRTVLPDGSIRITIREPICTTCQPWEY
jgi:hypothetical protein